MLEWRHSSLLNCVEVTERECGNCFVQFLTNNASCEVFVQTVNSLFLMKRAVHPFTLAHR